MIAISTTKKDRFIKTTINIRSHMMLEAHARMLDLGKEDFIDYLRDLIQLDLRYKVLGTFDPICLQEFRRLVDFPREETGREALQRIVSKPSKRRKKKPRAYDGPPKKFPGFITGDRGRNFWPVLQLARKVRANWEVQQSKLNRK